MSERDPAVRIDEDVDNIVVVEPGDYRKTQKLKAIQNAKDHFRQLKRNRFSREAELGTYANPEEAYEIELAEAVTDYVSELVPIIEEGLEAGSLEESDNMITTIREDRKLPLTGLAKYHGRMESNGETKSLSTQDCTMVYTQCERIERKMGLGLKLEKDKGPAQI